MPRCKYGSDYDRITTNVTVADSGCWLWQQRLTEKGYGRLNVGGQIFRAHRYAYELWRGPIGEGLSLDHLCRVRSCVNPMHLEAVTQAENLRRSDLAIPTRNAQKTHCKRGHEFNADNTYLDPRESGGRRCRACRAEAAHRHQLRASGVQVAA